jgi:FkbM family methyltransferase
MSSSSKALQSYLHTEVRRAVRKAAEDISSRALRSPRLRGYAFNALHLLADSASVNVDGLQYFFPTSDWIIGRSLYIDGRWDDEFLKAAIDLVAGLPGGRQVDDGIFVDVGANIGTTSVQALGRYHAKRAIVIEPSPQCLPYLYSNIAANRFSGRCDVIEAAVSDEAGEVAFRAGGDNSGAGEVLHGARDGTQDYIIKSQRLDDIISFLGVDFGELSLVWVDTEGHECRVLSGAKKVIEANVPIVIEFWPERLRENGDYDRLVEMLARSFRTIIDIRAHVQGTRDSFVKSSIFAINAQAEALGPWPTDLLLVS